MHTTSLERWQQTAVSALGPGRSTPSAASRARYFYRPSPCSWSGRAWSVSFTPSASRSIRPGGDLGFRGERPEHCHPRPWPRPPPPRAPCSQAPAQRPQSPCCLPPCPCGRADVGPCRRRSLGGEVSSLAMAGPSHGARRRRPRHQLVVGIAQEVGEDSPRPGGAAHPPTLHPDGD